MVDSLFRTNKFNKPFEENIMELITQHAEEFNIDALCRDNNLPATASILNFERDPSRTSNRYQSTDDVAVLRAMNEQGWFINSYRQVKAHDAQKGIFKTYLATYTHPQFPALGDEGRLTILQRNAKDGTKTFAFNVGFFRFVCTNGLIVGSKLIEPINVRHIGEAPTKVLEVLDLVLDKSPMLYERVGAMQKVMLTDSQALDFAAKGLELRFGENRIIEPKDLLVSQRNSDEGQSLWKVFNKVQERLMKPQGLIGKSKENKTRKVSAIKNINLDYNINTGLWDMAEEYMQNLA
jgi:hypothetical protein